MKTTSIASLLVTATLSALSAAPALAVVDGPKVAWNLSVWGPPRAFTAGIETLSKYLDQETGGKFTIKIHYGGALSKGQDNLDNIKLGSFEIAQICTGYHPGKHLGINVLDLPGLPLGDEQVHALVHDAVFEHPYIVNEFKRWDAKLLMTVIQPQSEFMGVGAPPMTMADYKGMRLRALGGTGAAMKNLGAVPTSVPAPEVYNALERGVFRAPKNAIGVGVLRREVVAHMAVVAVERSAVVIPMHGHGQRVADEGAPGEAGQAIVHCA